MRLYNIDANLMQFVENLYNKATSAVYLNVAYETGSEPQSESGKAVYSHRLSSTSFWSEV